MNDWPDGWTDRDRRGYGRGSASSQPEGARVMRHVQRGPGGAPSAPPRGGVPPQPGHGPDQRYGHQDPYDRGGYDSGYSEGQVYGGGRGGGGRGDDDGYYGDRSRPAPNWGRRIKVGLITLVVVALVWSVGTYFWADSQLKREVDLSKVIDRPSGGDGTNYLIVGSDSREGMTAEDKKRLHTGSAGEGSSRTDSMMILHVGSNGDTLISLPRDSDVEIPSFIGSDSGKKFPAEGRRVKLNAAYSEDGPELLVRTVEHNTGLKIDHYAEIGFGGFAKIVDAVGGVDIKVEQTMKDKKSGSNFEPGTHEMNGEQALAFVRQRYGLSGGDLDRTKNQQKFLSALANQTATPSTILNPFKLYPTMGAGLDTLIVDEDMGLFDLAEMFWAMKSVSGGEGKSLNMPIAGGAPGGNLAWDKTRVRQLVEQLNNDEKVTVEGGYGN